MIKHMSIGPVVVSLQDFFKSGQLFKLWEWKLDSFWSEEEAGDIIITGDLSGDSTYPGNIVSEEISGFFTKQIIKAGNRHIFRFFRRKNEETLLAFNVDESWKQITLLEDNNEYLRQLSFEYLSHIIPYSMLTKDVLTFHGVLMEYNGNGIIISAPSGTGKTTHARLWKKYRNSFIINGDKASCYKKNGVWTGFGTPWCGTSGEYMNREVPIKAIVVLDRAEKNSAALCSGFEGFKKIFPHVLYPNWDEKLTDQAMNLLDDFMENVPVYNLKCLPDEESVEVLSKVLSL